jgi:hypothetical protein
MIPRRPADRGAALCYSAAQESRMVVARKLAPKTKTRTKSPALASPRQATKSANSMQRKIDKVIRRRAPALRKLD